LRLLFPFSFFNQIEKQSETLNEAFFIRVFYFPAFHFFCSLLKTHLLEFEIIVEKLVNLLAIEGSPMPRVVEEDFNDFKGREVYFNNW